MKYILILLLAGCAPYWVRTSPPVPVSAVITLPDLSVVCQQRVWGCFNRQTGVIYIWAGVPEAAKHCVITHEERHAEGWDHGDQGHLSADCGDGTVWLP